MFNENLTGAYCTFFSGCYQFAALPISTAASMGVIPFIMGAMTGILEVSMAITSVIAITTAFLAALTMIITYPLASALDSFCM